MSKKKIVVVGSSNTDMVVKTSQLPVPGETVLGGTFIMNPGGKGANQAVAAARMGGDVAFVFKAGDDLFGRQSSELYDQENIDTGCSFTDPALPSGVALITVNGEGENCIVVASGANSSLDRKDIDEAAEMIRGASILLMQLEIPLDTVEYAAGIAASAGVKVILNPAPAQSIPETLFPKLHMLIPNETEASILSGVKVTDWESGKKAAAVLRGKGVDKVIVTMGSRGALVCDGDGCLEVPVAKVKAVDTTAAGDTFCGALCVALAEGAEMRKAVEFANRAAAISVTRMGAQSSIPFRREVDS